MKSIHQWLKEYGEGHQNSRNLAIHKVAVPAIVLSLMGILWCLPFPFALQSDLINWCTISMVCVLIYYLRLEKSLAIGMLLIAIILVSLFLLWDSFHHASLILTMIAVFVLAWIAQFIGHFIEGNRPSFFWNLNYFLIGPLWVLAAWYKKWRIPWGRAKE